MEEQASTCLFLAARPHVPFLFHVKQRLKKYNRGVATAGSPCFVSPRYLFGGNPSMILSVINQKGGVGKTTTAINAAVSLAQWGRRVLLVDVDPQGNATSGLGLRASAPGQEMPSLYSALGGEVTLREVERATRVPNLWAVGAAQELAGAEVELGSEPRRDTLKKVLEEARDRYDIVMLDTPPSLSMLTVNALVAADELIIPVQCEYYALEGLGHLLRTLERVKRSLNPRLKVMGLLRTMFDARVGLSRQVSQELEQHFPTLLFKTAIPRNVRLAEAPSHGLPIALYDRRSPGADAYRRVAIEIAARAGLSDKPSGKPGNALPDVAD
jgi:chromosome partitioning protein